MINFFNKKKKKRFIRYLYWISEREFPSLKDKLLQNGLKIGKAILTPCEVLKASGNKVYYSTPNIWFRKCFRQSSWYRASKKSNKYLLTSEKKLPSFMEPFLNATIRESDFMPKFFPTREDLQKIVDSPCYQANKPDEWEKVSFEERIIFKLIFTVMGFWKWNESCNKYWLLHKANHANFLCQHYTTEVNGETVPYSISDNAGICSACLELFNIISDQSRKLVRGCPGAIMSGGLKKKKYYDVQPTQ